MHTFVTCIIVAGVGVLVAWFLNRSPDLEDGRLSQLVLVPGTLVLLALSTGPATIVMIALTAFLLAPGIAFNCGMVVSNFLDRGDWTPAEEEITLRPIQKLIDRDQFYQALGDLEALLKKYKPTYEALLFHANLLHHFGRLNDAATVLLKSIGLSHTTAQQLTVMELLAALEDHLPGPPEPLFPGKRRLRIRHDLILFQPGSTDRSRHKTIPPGSYEVGEIICRQHHWLKLAGENRGNAETCWEAVLEKPLPAPAPQKKSLFWPIARMHQAITRVLQGKPRRHSQAEAAQLLKEAGQFIRQEDWPAALPLLEKASACDPHRYEIAYRRVQAVRHTADNRTTALAVDKVLAQNQWSSDEQQMLRQLQHSVASKNKASLL